MRYRDLEGDEIIQPGDEVWHPVFELWIPILVGAPCIGDRVDETGLQWRRRLTEQPSPAPVNKYHRVIRPSMGEGGAVPITVDVYDVLTAFAVTCPAIQHAVKKLLCPGMRGTKSAKQDISEAIGSLHRALELMGGDGNEHD